MKLEDLMLGDWVQIRVFSISEKFERTEKYVHVRVAEIGTGLVTVKGFEVSEPYTICEDTEVEPVLLTKDILEKNGWKHYKDSEIYISTLRYMLDIEFFNNSPRILRNSLECKYVHQLQHVIRLYEIQKEIQL